MSAGTLTTNYIYYGWTEKVSLVGQGAGLKTMVTGALQNLTYVYDANGNIATITDTYPNPDETLTYTYDELYRLKLVSGPLYESYDYDGEGRLSFKTGTGTIGYGTGNPSPFHGAKTSSGRSYGYDANGNMTSRTISGTTYTLNYDAENRLISYSGGGTNASFVYDGDGKRVSGAIGSEPGMLADEGME